MLKRLFVVLAIACCVLPVSRASYKEAYESCLYMYDSQTGIHHIMSIDGSAYIGNLSGDAMMDYIDEHCS